MRAPFSCSTSPATLGLLLVGSILVGSLGGHSRARAQEPAADALPADAPIYPTEEVILHGGEPGPIERRGVSVACSADGTRVIVGSEHSGARIFAHVGFEWIVEHQERAPSGRAMPETAVAMSADGTTALIGVPADGRVGAVRVLVRFDHVWTEQATLRASDGARGDGFGHAVALSRDGSRALVGVPRDDSPIDDAGSARVFVRQGGTWSEEGTLTAAAGAHRDRLGTSVALSGDGNVALIGAPSDDGVADEDSGSAHLFRLGPTGWGQEVVLRPRDLARRDLFGASVALSFDGLRAIVGAPGDDVSETRDAGSARVFSAVEGGWRDEATLTSTDRARGEMGSAVALSDDGTVALVGASRAHESAGVAWVITRSSAGWAAEGLIAARQAGHADRLGSAVALSSDGLRAVVGAPGDDVFGSEAAGSARTYVLARGEPGGVRSFAGTDAGRAEVFDADAGAERDDPSTRTAEAENNIRTGGIGALVAGGVAVVGGLALLIAGGLSSLSLSSSGGGTTSGGGVMLITGGVFATLGAISLIVGGIVYSQRTQRRQEFRASLAPLEGGAYFGIALDL